MNCVRCLHIPADIVVNEIITKLPTSHQAWAGRLICKLAPSLIPHNKVLPCDPDIPIQVLIEMCHRTTTPEQIAAVAMMRIRINDFDGLVAIVETFGSNILTTQLCTESATHGNLHIIQWLRSQDPPCPWDEFTCEKAALGGHLETLKWLRSQDPPCGMNGLVQKLLRANIWKY